MSGRRPNTRPKRTSRRSQNVPLAQGLRNLNETLRALTITTRTQGVPDKPDRIPMSMPRRKQIITITRSVKKAEIFVGNVETTGAASFALSDLPSYTDFTSLFDQYRICQITARFLPGVSLFGASTTTTDIPDLHTAVDLDDDTAPATVDTLRQFATHQVTPNQQYVERVWTPRFAVATYSGTFTSYSLAPSGQWIDSNSPGVLHYGVKWGMTPVSVASGQYLLYNVECTYVVQCRSPI